MKKLGKYAVRDKSPLWYAINTAEWIRDIVAGCAVLAGIYVCVLLASSAPI